MRAKIPHLLALAAVAPCLTAACGPAPAADPRAGTARLSVHARPLSTALSTPPICADFALLPFSLDASGNAITAGSAILLPRSGATAATAEIAGCIDSLASPAHDFRYLVSAGNFVDCGTGLPVPGLSQAGASKLVDFDCRAGLDVAVDASVDVAIATPNAGGYLDVSVGVNVSTPQSGCKTADIDGAGLLHFGQSYLASAGGPAPSAYTGIGLFNPGDTTGIAAPAGTLQQFAGTVRAPAGTDAYFTGLLQLPAAPRTATLVQAFAPACKAGEMTVQPRAVECVTQASLPSSVSTQVQIADVFVSWPGHATASASITGTQTIAVYTSLAGPNLGTAAPPHTGSDTLAQAQTLSLTAPDSFIGLAASLQHRGELVALVQTSSGAMVVLLKLNEGTGVWSAGPPKALSSFTAAQLTALGLFSASTEGGCYPMPAACDLVCSKPASAVHFKDSDFATWTLHPFSDPLGGPTNATAARVLDGANPVLEVVDLLGPLGPPPLNQQSNIQALLDFPSATWAPQTQGAITGLYFDVDLRVLDRTLYQYDGTSFPGTFFRTDDQYGNGFNVEALIEQGGHHFTASLAFGCAVAGDPGCTQWHHAAGGYNQNGTAGNLTFSSFQEPFHAAPQPLLDLSATGAPMTFGLSLAVSGGSAGYVGAYRGQVDNFDVSICQCQ